MRIERLCFLLLAVLVLAPVTAGAQSTYYVAPPPAGGDGQSGAQGSPWATLQHAADTVAAGDTVMVLPGTYAGFNLETSGTANAPIRFLAQRGVIINQRNATTPDGINLEGASFVEIEGFTLNGTPRAGIRAVLCERVTIRNNIADRNERWGILTGFCDDLVIEGNRVSNSVAEHGVYVSNSGDRPIIRGNTLFSNNANGIHMNGDASQGGDGIISGALVERNIIYDNGTGGGSGINCDGVQDSTFQNNLIYDSHASGISLYQIDGGAPARNNLIINNTVVVANDGRWALNIQDGSTGNRIYNNILINLHPSRGSIDISADSLTGFLSDNNVLMDRLTTDGGNTILTLLEWRGATSQDASSLTATPAQLFRDFAQDDYHLATNSPAIDEGRATDAPPTDIEGTARSGAVDIGAFEHCGAGCIVDAGLIDATPVDAGPGADITPLADASAGTDGTTSADAASTADAAVAADAALGLDAGVPGDAGSSPDDSGCGCRAAGPSDVRGSIGLALAMLTMLARRRRRAA
ncbi:MAG: right-handed parallel beta-helix repeat-containing protein [Deltaproteobacteria bacterium]|nr:right-handed parallel beta-helix repeat-containing protein [Deltaproteobacteria bacterium]